MCEGEDHLYIQEKEKKSLAHVEEEPIKDQTLSKKVRMEYPSLMQMVRSSKGGPFMIQKLFNFYPKHHRIIPRIKNLRSGANDRLNYT